MARNDGSGQDGEPGSRDESGGRERRDDRRPRQPRQGRGTTAGRGRSFEDRSSQPSAGGRGPRGGRTVDRRGGEGARDGERRPARPAAKDSRGRGPERSGPRGATGGRRRDQAPRPSDPRLPEEVTGKELSGDVLDALSTLPPDLKTSVGRHLVMVGNLLEEEPELAWEHAQAALRKASRVGVVREVAGTVAYRVGRFDIALRELRAAKRMTGAVDYLPMMADAERGLGRPGKALELAASPDAARLDVAGRLEMLIVASGAHLDLGDPAAAKAELDIAELDRSPTSGGVDARAARARLFCAYADALEALGEPAREWLEKAAAADVDGSTGAAARLGWEQDFTVVDLAEEDPGPQAGDPGQDGRPGPGAAGGRH